MTAMLRFFISFGAVAVLSGSLAQAQKQPPPFPLRDAVVEYQQQAAGLTIDVVQIYYSASTKRDRVVSGRQGPGSFAIQDFGAKKMLFVLPGQPPSYSEMPLPDATTYVTTGERATIIGQQCEVWQVQATAAPALRTTVCLTPEGIMLRSTTEAPGGAGSIVMEATSISYGPQDPTLFVLPPGPSINDRRPSDRD
jgi:hypothetical protein